MNEEVPTIRDCFAMFAMMGLVINENRSAIPEMAYQLADAMMEARNAKPEIGIKTVRKGKKQC